MKKPAFVGASKLVTCESVPGVTARLSRDAAEATDRKLVMRVRRRMLLVGEVDGSSKWGSVSVGTVSLISFVISRNACAHQRR